jgi:hypothetical protein
MGEKPLPHGSGTNTGGKKDHKVFQAIFYGGLEMKLSVTIEVDDRVPEEELCGKGCKGLNKGFCHIFNTQLEDDSRNKMTHDDNGTLRLEATREIFAWNRCKPCISMFYSFGDRKPHEDI